MKFSFQRKEKDPNIVQGIKVPYAPAKRQAAKWRWYLILFVVSSPLLYFIFKLILSQVIVTAQGFISLEKVAVNSTSTGTIQKLYVEVGQELTSGGIFAQLYNASLSSQKIMLESELSALDHPEITYDKAQEVLLRKRIDLTKDVLNFERKYFANVKFLFDQGAATVAELDLARERKIKAQLDHEHARFELGSLLENRQKYPILPEIEVTKKRRQIDAKLKALGLQQARLTQTLPYDGRILDVFAKEGETVSTGSSLLLLGRSDKPTVIAYLSPKYAKYARKGLKAVVKLPNGETLQAEVNTDSNLTKRLPADLSSPIGSRDLMLLVRLKLESPLPDFHWVDGLPVSVRFKARI